MNDSFCPLPWLGYSIRNNGDIRVCCHANQGPTRGILLKDNDEPFRYNDSIEETRNSKMLKDVRCMILNGEWHPECIRCEREFKSGLLSRNYNESEMWEPYFTEEQAIKLTDKDGSINPFEIPLNYFDLRFGNICNLRCRMCFPTDSSGWYKEYEAMMGTNEYNDTIGKVKIIKDGNKFIAEGNPYDWYKEEIFWDELSKYKSQIRLLYIVGGEPMLVHEHFDFLEDCINIGVAEDIRLEYNTNLTVIPVRVVNIWKEFKEIRFGVSIDGYGKVNDYIRWPSKFSTIEKNLRIIDNADSNYMIRIAYTVSVYNILHLPEFIIWKLKQNFNKVNINNWYPLITTHPLHKPMHLNIKIFSKKSKDIIKQMLIDGIIKIHQTIDEYNSPHPEKSKKAASRIINGYIEYMYQDDYSEFIPRFWEFNNRLDEIRGCKLYDYIPELKGLI